MWISKKTSDLIEIIDLGTAAFAVLIGIGLIFVGTMVSYPIDFTFTNLILSPIWLICLICGLWLILIRAKIRVVTLSKTSGKAIIATGGLLKRERLEIPMKEVKKVKIESQRMQMSYTTNEWSRIFLVTGKEEKYGHAMVGESKLISEAEKIAKEMADFLNIPVEEKLG